MRVHDIFQPTNYPALLQIRPVQSDPVNGRAYLTTSELAIDPDEIHNGQVTALQITNPGSGYQANAHLGCSITPSTNPKITIPPTGTPDQATCYGITDASGKLIRLTLAQPGLGYLASPTVTLDPPPSGGTPATAQARIAPMQNYIPVGHLVIDSFYLPTAGTVSPGTTVTLAHLPCPDANGVASSAPVMQDQVSVISMGSQNWAVPGVVVTALATGFGQCTVTIDNRTTTPLHYGAGTPRQPWELLVIDPASGDEQTDGLGPQGILASSVTSRITTAATATRMTSTLSATTDVLAVSHSTQDATPLASFTLPEP